MKLNTDGACKGGNKAGCGGIIVLLEGMMENGLVVLLNSLASAMRLWWSFGECLRV